MSCSVWPLSLLEAGFLCYSSTALAGGYSCVTPCSSIKKSVAYHNWFALPERPVSDARAPFVLPEYLKMALSKSVMRNVARFRIRGHGLKCETGLYGRSPDRSARVCNLCENGDYIQDEKHVVISCMGTSSTINFIIILKVISKVLFRLHREMHMALSLLPRRTQQLRETGETEEN